MEMFLTLMVLSVVGTLVGGALLVAAAKPHTPRPEEMPRSLPLPATRFFAESASSPATQVPIEVLLLQIERHVRLEQTAAESFVDLPTRELLHSRTSSPLVH